MRTNLQRRKLVLNGSTLTALLLLAGCGGSSTKAGPEARFLGRWEIVNTTTTFTLACPGATAQPYLQWVELIFEHGTATDLNETSGLTDDFGCSPFLSYDVAGDVATVVNPDPYLGEAPFCDALAFDAMGNPVALLEFTPNSDWQFVLTDKGSADEPPKGRLQGSATVTPFVPDATTGMLVAQAACTYSSAGGDAFYRMTQP